MILDYLHRENWMVVGKLLNKQRLGNSFEIVTTGIIKDQVQTHAKQNHKTGSVFKLKHCFPETWLKSAKGAGSKNTDIRMKRVGEMGL